MSFIEKLKLLTKKKSKWYVEFQGESFMGNRVVTLRCEVMARSKSEAFSVAFDDNYKSILNSKPKTTGHFAEEVE